MPTYAIGLPDRHGSKVPVGSVNLADDQIADAGGRLHTYPPGKAVD